ncbi:unnamed protein product [Paramecium pentaurelia]|uniref:Transmembrane protein n=1 Tax=Paramecium pentaurelia TaxID=43138 RepID=A0A8S1TMR9_9CILI|nr:unnamed protein product [Paramecium pentaurelia]
MIIIQNILNFIELTLVLFNYIYFYLMLNVSSSVKNTMEEFYQIQNGTILQELTKQKYQNCQQLFINLVLTIMIFITYAAHYQFDQQLSQNYLQLEQQVITLISQPLQNMEIFRKYFGVLITSNFSNHILSICEVDQTSKNQNSKEYIKYFMNLVQYRINHNCKLKLKKNCLSKKNQIVKYDQEIRLHGRVLMQQVLKIY